MAGGNQTQAKTMAYDQTDILSTPEGYATPGQTAAVREYAKALLYGKGQQPVRHWTQAVSNIVSALVGGADLYGAGKRDRASDLYDANKLPRDMGDRGPSSTAMVLGPQAGAAPPMRAPPVSPLASGYQSEGDDAPKVVSQGTGSILPGGERILGWDPPVPAGAPGAGAALPFSGEPVNAPPEGENAPAAIARALAAGGKAGLGGPPPFPGGGVATKAPFDPATGQVVIPPGLVPHRIPVTRDSFVNTAASQRLTPEMKKLVTDQYYGQRQPLQMAIPGGAVLINPRDPTQQMPMYDIGESEVEAKGAKIKQKYQMVPDGKGGFVQKIIPRVEPGEPASRGAPAPASKASTPPSLDDVPGILQYAPTEEPPPGMLGAKPPVGAQTAQLPPVLDRMIDAVTEKEISQKQREHINVKDFDSFDKKYTTVTNAGEDAAKLSPMISLARQAIEDPKYYSGIGADLVVNYKRLMAQVGSDPNAAAANELFDKITSGAILGDMRATLQGLGQVRVAEIDLLSKAMANRYNSVPANRAVLDLMERTHKQASFLSDRASDYREGWRWDDKGKPYKTGEAPTYAGLSTTLKKFIEKMPTLPKEKILEYNRLFDKEGYDSEKYKSIRADLGSAASGKPSTGAPAAAEPPPPPGTTRLPTPK